MRLSHLTRRSTTALLATALLGFGLMAGPAHAVEYATQAEAKEMAERAAALIADQGLEAATPQLALAPGPFHDRDLYVVVFNRDGRALFHGTQPMLVGRSMIDFKDVAGVPFVRNIVAVKEKTWSELRWINPQTKQIQQKSMFVVPVGDSLLVCVGAYTPT